MSLEGYGTSVARRVGRNVSAALTQMAKSRSDSKSARDASDVLLEQHGAEVGDTTPTAMET